MSKEDIINSLITDKKIDEKEAQSKYDEFEKDAKDFGYDDEAAVEDYVKRRFNSYLSKQNISTGSMETGEFQFIIIGKKFNDFGASSKYKKHLEAYEKNPEKAIELGYVNEEGEPLYTDGFKKGNVIDIKKETRKEFHGLIKRLDGDKPDNSYRLQYVVANGDNFDKDLKTCVVYKSKLGIGKNNMFYIDATQPEEVKKLSVEDVKKMAEMFFKPHNRYFSVNEAFEFFKGKSREEISQLYGFNDYCLIYGDVTQINITDKNYDLLTINDNQSDSPEIIKGFINKKLFNIDFDERAMDVFMFGIPSFDEERNELNLPAFNCLGFYRDDRYKVKVQPKPVTPETKKETSDDEEDVEFI